MNKMKTRTALFLILIIALALRLPHLFDKEFGIDERGTTIEAKIIKESASLKYLYTLPTEVNEINPPLFFNVLGLSLYLYDSIATLRIFVLIIGLLSIIMFFLLVKSLFNERMALFSTFLYAITPMHIIYSQHVRVYIFLFLLFTLSMYFLQKFLFYKDSKSLLYLGIIYAVSIYSHYYTMLFMLGNGVTVIIFYYLNRDIKLSRYIYLAFIVLLLSIPALLLLKFQFQTYMANGGTQWSGGIMPILTVKGILYPVYKYSVMADVSTTLKNFPYVFALFPLLIGLSIYGAIKLYKHSIEKFIFICCNMVFPYIFYVIIGFIWPLFSFRYLTFFLPAYVLLFSYGLFNIRNKYLKWILLALLIVGWLIVIFYYYDIIQYRLWGEHIAI